MNNNFLPISKDDLKKRGWNSLDVIIITGDAYVDHPSYGASVIGRLLENNGFKVGIIAQPNWKTTNDFLSLGKPRLFFGITSGNVDSMVANYTANKKSRKTDDYSPGEKAGLRPDRSVIVYANRIKELFGDVPIVIGGIEASLRRLAHYDYWDNSVRRSILLDSKADILVYGMGEKQILEIAERLNKGEEISSLNNIRGTVIVQKKIDFLKDYLKLPSFEEVKENKDKFIEAFKIIYSQMNPYTAKSIIQEHNTRFVIQNPPALPHTEKELDEVYALPFQRAGHPVYNKYGGVKGLEIVKFSIISHRGCCGECSFCSLFFHQGKIIQSRSMNSILKEANLIAQKQDFKGTINDVGGPTANLYKANCSLWEKRGCCENKKCLNPEKCNNLKLGYKDCLSLYRRIRQIPNVKHVFLSSGLRYDLLITSEADEYLEELCKYHISGQLKIAPEHTQSNVLKLMNKPSFAIYEKFIDKFEKTKNKVKKNIFIVNYFITSHPGTTSKEAFEFASHLKRKGMLYPEQIQDFTPTPMTLSTCIYYTEKNPITNEKVYVPKTFHERKMQRAIIQNKSSSKNY